MTPDTTKVVIPTEIKTRELTGKLFLASILAGRNYEVYVGNKLKHTALDKIDPDIFLGDSSGGREERLSLLSEHGIKIAILDAEGSAFPGAENFSKSIDKETLQHVDCYCAWGDIAKNVIKKESPNTRVEVTGNPRFDLLQDPHRNFYEQTATNITKQYGEFILFNTNFAGINGQKPTKEMASNFIDDHPVLKKALESDKTQIKIFTEFIRLICEVAEEYPEQNIIVRPHPSEKSDIYENSLYAYKNVHIEQRFEVRPWILAAETVIHNSCTTGVTSALLNTPVIAYVPDGLELNSTPNEVSDRCETITEVCNTIQDYLYRKKSFTLDSTTKSKIRQHIDNIDYLSAEQIADVLDSIKSAETDRISLPVDNKLRLRRALVRTLGSRRFEEMYVKGIRRENRHKFPYTSTNEIKSIIERFSDNIKPAGLQVDRLPYAVNGFRLQCNR